MYRFDAYDLALQAALALRPLLDPINRRDPDLCRQIRRAASSVAMCLHQGSQRSGRDRFHLYRNIRQTSADLLRNAPGYACPIRTTLSTTAPIPRGETHGFYTPGFHRLHRGLWRLIGRLAVTKV